MFKFTKSNISASYSWFATKLDDNFEIEIGGSSKVIFGYNGIGKSTIFKCIKEMDNSEVEYLNYQNNDQTQQASDKLLISININAIMDLESKIKSYGEILSPKTQLRNNSGITDTIAKKVSKDLLSIKKAERLDALKSSKEKLNEFVNNHIHINAKTLFEVWEKLESVSDANTELKNEKDKKKYMALRYANEIVKDDDNICPICDSETAELKSKIKAKMEALATVKSELISLLETKNISTSIEVLEDYISAYKDLKDDSNLAIDYAICGGNLLIYENISKAISEVKTLKASISSLQSDAEIKYNAVKSIQKRLKKDLKRYFDVDDSNVIFKDASFSVEIKFPRKIETYSTGEINLISFIYRLYSFIGSDKETLILDDPVSSLDLMNHYKIAYEIVRNAENKVMIVLTHSVEFVNTVNSQYPGGKFRYYYLEENNSKLTISEINYNKSGSNPNVISLKQLNSSDIFVGALIDRETSENSSNLNVFHYNPQEFFIDNNPSNLSNHKLQDLIESFSGFTTTNFYDDSLLKIKYICALRIWIEYKLYSYIPSNDNASQKEFIDRKQINEKIDFILPRNGSKPFSTGNLSREDLMSKKVMLNQGVHYYSQVMPMAYAINLSFDQLANEIKEIKEMFI